MARKKPLETGQFSQHRISRWTWPLSILAISTITFFTLRNWWPYILENYSRSLALGLFTLAIAPAIIDTIKTRTINVEILPIVAALALVTAGLMYAAESEEIANEVIEKCEKALAAVSRAPGEQKDLFTYNIELAAADTLRRKLSARFFPPTRRVERKCIGVFP